MIRMGDPDDEKMAFLEEKDNEEGGEEEQEEEVGVLFVHNVMACAQLNCQVNLDNACKVLGNSVFNPEEFHSVRVDVRCKQSKSVASINLFSNGKIMGTGASSVEELRRTMKKIAKRLKTHPLTKYPVRLTRFRVSNILGSYCYPSPLSLHLLSSQRNLHVDYEPERFPGARVKIIIPKKDTCRSSLDDEEEEEEEEEEEDTQDLKPTNTSFPSIPSLSSHARGGVEAGMNKKKKSKSLTGAWSSTSLLQQTNTNRTSMNGASSGVSNPSSSNIEDDESIRNLFCRKEEIVTLQIFSTGNVTLTGGRAVESMEYALQCIIPFLQQCQVINSTSSTSTSHNGHNSLNCKSLQFNRHPHTYL
ncbi:tata-box binding protein tbp1 [Cystoisospora suis]|uniref:Tata-box binding protein tbp1 n=1 Tax=Cystoisospora suis TaxID=483139 RepID=A0A2C6LDH5_9APIC|nr:tata-box binding protein tbp1 [Cystoisospora suis]